MDINLSIFQALSNLILITPYEVEIMVALLQVRKKRHREVK